MSDKIILMGFMGCGKSTVGRQVAKQLGYDFVDLDDEIEEVAKTSISNIFANKGESYFRKLESKTLKLVLTKDESLVLALGGGTPCHNNNLKLIKKYPSFYIRCGVEVLSKRLIKEKAHRPIIADQKPSELKSFINSKLKSRNGFYKKADHTVLGFRSVAEVSKRIVDLL